MSEQKTVDLTPSWESAAEILILVMDNGTEEGKRLAKEEIRNMARAADRALALVKDYNDLLARVKEQGDEISHLETQLDNANEECKG